MDLEFSKEVSSEIKNVLRFFKREVLEGERVYLYLGETVFKGLGNEGCSGTLYSALLPMKRGKSALDAYETWDLHLGWGMPYADCNGRKKRTSICWPKEAKLHLLWRVLLRGEWRNLCNLRVFF